jgi:hypothetical protein
MQDRLENGRFLHNLEGDVYGTVVVLLKRVVRT